MKPKTFRIAVPALLAAFPVLASAQQADPQLATRVADETAVIGYVIAVEDGSLAISNIPLITPGRTVALAGGGSWKTDGSEDAEAVEAVGRATVERGAEPEAIEDKAPKPKAFAFANDQGEVFSGEMDDEGNPQADSVERVMVAGGGEVRFHSFVITEATLRPEQVVPGMRVRVEFHLDGDTRVARSIELLLEVDPDQ